MAKSPRSLVIVLTPAMVTDIMRSELHCGDSMAAGLLEGVDFYFFG